jgi:ParB-like chromosome segregation protein Spo0J
MEVKKVSINDIKTNPDNPRIIKDYKFSKLVNSIREFPQMLKLRPIVVNNQNVILGGNMRYKASIEAGLKEVYIVQADELSDEQQKEFIIKDNIGFGEWDWDLLGNQFDFEQLEDWGLDTIKHDWEDLDYIDEDVEAPNLETNKIVITITDEYLDVKEKLTNELKDWITENYLGCEVK